MSEGEIDRLGLGMNTEAVHDRPHVGALDLDVRTSRRGGHWLVSLTLSHVNALVFTVPPPRRRLARDGLAARRSLPMPFANNGSVQIFYETFGDPAEPTLVLVNGLGSQCINFRTEWCERFVAKGFQVVRMDNRDVGLSTHFSDVTPDSRARGRPDGRRTGGGARTRCSDMAADVVAVLDALGVEQAHVMGLSMGGMIVQTLAIEHPERLRSMTSVMSTTGRARRRPGRRPRRGLGCSDRRRPTASPPSPTTSPGCASGAARARSTRRRRRGTPARRTTVPSTRPAWPARSWASRRAAPGPTRCAR